MAKIREINTSFDVSYIERDKNTNDDIIRLNMSWENSQNEDEVIKNLNTWLTAIGMGNLVVGKNLIN